MVTLSKLKLILVFEFLLAATHPPHFGFVTQRPVNFPMSTLPPFIPTQPVDNGISSAGSGSYAECGAKNGSPVNKIKN